MNSCILRTSARCTDFRGSSAALCSLAILLLTACTHEAGLAEPAAELEDVIRRYFSADFMQRSTAYHRLRLQLFLLQSALVLVALYIMNRGYRPGLAHWCLRRTGHRPWAARLLLISMIYTGFALLRLPFSLARYDHAGNYGLRHDTLSQYLLDWITATTTGWMLVALTGSILLGLFPRFPRRWWLVSGFAVSILAVGFTMMAPLVIDPMYYRFKPMDEGPLKSRLLEVARSADTDVREILIADASRRSRSMNAYFSGFGHTRRIVLFDNLINRMTPDEVVSVIAHEAAHWKLGHIRRGLMIGLSTTFLGLYLIQKLFERLLRRRPDRYSGKSDPGLVVPAYSVYLLAMYLALVPANRISRIMETEADRVSLQLTRDPETFIRSNVRIARQNLSNVLPSPWVEYALFTHPSKARRIRMAEQVQMESAK